MVIIHKIFHFFLTILLIFPSMVRSIDVTFDDEFSWMENNSKSLQYWLKIRSDLASNFLDNLSDNKTINDNYDKVDNLLSESEPSMNFLQFSQNGMFYLKYGNQVFLKNNKGEDKLIIEPPNDYYIHDFSSSPDGHYVAYSLFKNGLESGNIKIIDVYSGKVFSDTIENVKFPNIIWNKDNKSFFYTKQYYNSIEKKQTYGEIYLHKVGNKPGSDTLIFGQKNDLNLQRSQYPSIKLSSNSNWVIASIGAGTTGSSLKLFATKYDTLSKNSQWIKIISADEKYTNFALDKNYLYLIKENTSSGHTLLCLNLDDPKLKSEEIYQWHNGPIKQFSITKNSIYLVYNENLIQKFIRIPFDNISHIQNIKLPYQSEITALFANNEQSKLLFTLQDWLIPASVFSYDEKSNQIKHYLYSVKKSLFTTKYDVEVKMITSKDNASVPLTIIHQKGLKLNASSPTWLTAYGAYGVSLLPYFLWNVHTFSYQ